MSKTPPPFTAKEHSKQASQLDSELISELERVEKLISKQSPLSNVEQATIDILGKIMADRAFEYLALGKHRKPAKRKK